MNAITKLAPSEPMTIEEFLAFKVLSRSNTKAWREWRRVNYPSIPNCQHYFTVSRTEIECYDRATGWQPRKVTELSGSLDLPALGTALRLADVYWRTPLADGTPVQRRDRSGRPRDNRRRSTAKHSASSRGGSRT